MIGVSEHLLVLQTVTREQTGEYRCQVTMDTPPFQFIQSSSHLTVMVLPERHPVISGIKKIPYLPGDKLKINCTSSPSFPAAHLSWLINHKSVDRWMVTSYVSTSSKDGLESSSLGLSFLVLPEHFQGEEQELWVTCRASMPSIKGVELPIERTMMLGTIKLHHFHGGWVASRGMCWGKLSRILLLVMIMIKAPLL